jgi:hypothetical protein
MRYELNFKLNLLNRIHLKLLILGSFFSFIKKTSVLKKTLVGILTEEEFNIKKQELLKKI